MPDELDLSLLHALSLDGRASFSTIARVLGVSVQTIQRRYARLQDGAGLRVVAGVDPTAGGEAQWLLRLTASTSGAQRIAGALAARSDTSWVQLASGGTEIIAIVTTRARSTSTAPQELLLRDLPRTAGVTAVAAHQLIHVFRGGPVPWSGRRQALTSQQQAEISATPPEGRTRTSARDLRPDDHRIIAALARDARATLRSLSSTTGLSESTVARRLEDLRADGTLYFDIDLDDAVVHGVTDKTFLWLSVPPSHLEETAAALMGHPRLAYVAAVTGPTNLVAIALSSSAGGLYEYLSRELAGIDTITHLETAPVLHTLKTVPRL